MPPYLSDRQRIELGLPPRLLRRVLEGAMALQVGAGGTVSDDDHECVRMLREAEFEAFSGLSQGDAAKMQARLDRTQREFLREHEQAAIMKVFLLVLYWLHERLEEGTLEMREGTAFDVASSALIGRLSEFEDIWGDVEKSARKQARRLQDRMRSLGYFRTPAATPAATAA